MNNKPQPQIKVNNKLAKIIIYTLSIIVLIVVVSIPKIMIFRNLNLGFNPHLFATFNAINNGLVTLLLFAGVITIKKQNYLVHKKIMITAIVLSSLFLISYILHHLFSGETLFGDMDHNGLVDVVEKEKAGFMRIVYYIILGTHIPLAGIILPFILFSAYNALSGQYEQHKKVVRYTFPIWLYVAVTGVLVYLLISPYYTN